MGANHSQDMSSCSSRPNASSADVRKAVDDAARGSGFRCTPVSWEDAQRGSVNGQLSCWGGNISDVRIWERNDSLVFTLRTDNWNERLGYVSAKDVAVVVGNHRHVAGSAESPEAVTLEHYLAHFGQYAAYAAGCSGSDSSSATLLAGDVDELFSIRFQTVFLPLRPGGDAPEFCTEVYNYNTLTDSDPRNALLLCTSQGTSVQQDGRGAKRLFHHEVDGAGVVHRYWLEGEQSRHRVGGAQIESLGEKEDAVRRGKSTSMHIGTPAMGTRFNVQMLIQLPLQQDAKPKRFGGLCTDDADANATLNALAAAIAEMSELGQSIQLELEQQGSQLECIQSTCASTNSGKANRTAQAVGTSRAARVSRGKEEDVWGGLSKNSLARDQSMHGTITVTLYYAVAGGVPSASDVQAAIADLEELYAACPSDRRLAQCSEITAPLSADAMNSIAAKVVAQPYGPTVTGIVL